MHKSLQVIGARMRRLYLRTAREHSRMIGRRPHEVDWKDEVMRQKLHSGMVSVVFANPFCPQEKLERFLYSSSNLLASSPTPGVFNSHVREFLAEIGIPLSHGAPEITKLLKELREIQERVELAIHGSKFVGSKTGGWINGSADKKQAADSKHQISLKATDAYANLVPELQRSALAIPFVEESIRQQWMHK